MKSKGPSTNTKKNKTEKNLPPISIIPNGGIILVFAVALIMDNTDGSASVAISGPQNSVALWYCTCIIYISFLLNYIF
jgi:hypothetical protein